MGITRREFAYGIAGIALAATAAEPPRIYERRVYTQGSTLPPPEILSRHGIRPLSVKGAEYLISFASLEARASAWDRFNTDDVWCEMRDRGNVTLQEIQIYPGGKIFEMSL
ncbi:MAG TPA: hypothetical protein VLM42_04660 [Bryobacteraceae bacterium]|nr:hypothetical protein [Bryobacteraceae bacterium]